MLFPLPLVSPLPSKRDNGVASPFGKVRSANSTKEPQQILPTNKVSPTTSLSPLSNNDSRSSRSSSSHSPKRRHCEHHQRRQTRRYRPAPQATYPYYPPGFPIPYQEVLPMLPVSTLCSPVPAYPTYPIYYCQRRCPYGPGYYPEVFPCLPLSSACRFASPNIVTCPSSLSLSSSGLTCPVSSTQALCQVLV